MPLQVLQVMRSLSLDAAPIHSVLVDEGLFKITSVAVRNVSYTITTATPPEEGNSHASPGRIALIIVYTLLIFGAVFVLLSSGYKAYRERDCMRVRRVWMLLHVCCHSCVYSLPQYLGLTSHV
jgi:hypothetical protein